MLWFGGNKVMVCQRSSELVSKCVIVMDRICVCWPCVPGVMAFLSCLVICVVGFFCGECLFSAILPLWGLDGGLWFVYDVSSGCFSAVLVDGGVFFCLETIVTGLIYLLQVRQCHFWRGLTHFW